MRIEAKECFWCPLSGEDGDGKGSVWSVCQATLRRTENAGYEYDLMDLPVDGFHSSCPLLKEEVTVFRDQPEVTPASSG